MGALEDHVRFCGGSPDEIVTERRTVDGRAITLIFPRGKNKSITRWVEGGAHDINWLTWSTYGHLCQPGYDRGQKFAWERHLRAHGTPPRVGNKYDFPQDVVGEFKAWNRQHNIQMPDLPS